MAKLQFSLMKIYIYLIVVYLGEIVMRRDYSLNMQSLDKLKITFPKLKYNTIDFK